MRRPVQRRQRIALKIFLGYLPPLGIMLLLGLVLPFLVSTYLGRAIKNYEATVRLVDQAYALRRAAADSENNLRGYILYRDEAFRQQFGDARDQYRSRYRDIVMYVEEQQDRSFKPYVESANDLYRVWLRDSVRPVFDDADGRPRPLERRVVAPARAQAAAARSSKDFDRVQRALDRMVNAAVTYRDRQLLRARATERFRSLLTLGAPLFAALWAALIGRSIAIGITRPIEELTRATEELERGDTTGLLVTEHGYGDDEIGGLGRAFTQMARTIGQREAVLRAQNEALEAIGRRVEAVLNATNDGIVMLDSAGGFSVVNQRFAALFGLEADELLDQTFAQAGPLLLARFRDREGTRARIRAILADPEAVADETFEIVEPLPRVLRVYSAPVRGDRTDEEPDGELLGRIFVFRDVTRETAVDRMKTEFVSTVSHELRTPLTAIKGHLDLIASGRAGPLTPEQGEFVGMAQASTRRLSALINDMLDISRIESGRVEVRRESVAVPPLARDALRMLEHEAARRQVTLSLSTPEDAALPPVLGDADRITQVLVNLVGNGIKYTPAGGSVTVSAEAEEGVVTVCVADTGIGIAPEDQKRLFQKFFRADNSTTREVGGTGLGLAITKAILEKMHGTIWVDSALGQGSRFYFTLPAVPDAAPQAAPQRDASASPTDSGSFSAPKPLVLLVDEEPGMLHLLSQQFRRGGFITSGALTPEEALRRARDLRPDAVALNVASPHLDVFSVLYSLRTNPATRYVPVALLSLRRAGGSAEVRAPVGLLGLPLDPSAVRAALEAVFRPAAAPAAADEPVSKAKRLVLVVGDDALAGAVQEAAAGGISGTPGVRVASAAGPEAAEGMLEAPTLQRPDLIVLDLARVIGPSPGPAATLSETLRAYFTRGHGVPLLLVGPAPLWEGVRPLAAPGAAPVPPESLAAQVGILLREREQNVPAPLAGVPPT
jgi:PAS domain S-box-containing protein